MNEALEALDDSDIIFIQGGVGTGKSVIALHLTAYHGKGIIAVPFKNLELQYVNDYCGKGKNTVHTPRGTPLSVNNMRGRTNFPCLSPPPDAAPPVDCGHTKLPCTRRLEKHETRASVALECPHWSPVYPTGMLTPKMKQTRTTHPYESVGGPRYYCEADEPCPYYHQFRHYIHGEAIIMNAAKWEAETWLQRKPRVAVEIIDEADDFLDGLSYRVTVNQRLLDNLKQGNLVTEQEHQNLEIELARLTHRYAEQQEFELSHSPEVLSLLRGLAMILEEAEDSPLKGDQFKLSILLEYQRYAWAYVAGGDRSRSLVFYIPRLDITLSELRKRSGKLVLMSATRHSDENLQNIFRVQPRLVTAQEENPGRLILMAPTHRPPLNVNHRNWREKEFREKYWGLLDEQLRVAERPCYVLVHAFKYLPPKYLPQSKKDRKKTAWRLPEQRDVYFSTKLDRGADLRDDLCRAIILLKYPWPDLNDPVLKTMEKQIGASAFWEYTRDHANRNMLQQCGRAIRSPGDWCQVYSPDRNVVDNLERVWKGRLVKDGYSA